MFDDHLRRSGIALAVHLWRRQGEELGSFWDLADREKDLQDDSRKMNPMKRQREVHNLRHVISALADKLPLWRRNSPEVQDLFSYGCKTQMHVVRLLAPRLKTEITPNISTFRQKASAPAGAGLSDMRATRASRPWNAAHDPNEGLVLHNRATSQALAESAE